MTWNIEGKTVLVTGGTGGIGKEIARGLGKLGARLIITGRDAGRGREAAAELERDTGASVELLLADLSQLAEVRRLSEAVKQRHSRLDVLINNVGLLEPTRRLTADGIESHLAVNHLAPWLLTLLLLEPLHAGAPSRVINMTGGMPGAIDLADLQAERAFLTMRAYSQAKSVMMAASYELVERLGGSGIAVNVTHPGGADTAMSRSLTAGMVPAYMRLLWPLVGLSLGLLKAEDAARSSLFLASSAEVSGVSGVYFNRKGRKTRWHRDMVDPDKRKVIWELSERLTGVRTEELLRALPSAREAARAVS
jgi:NAD(P)-dependent dehydrogenase (short-subunit alcohol dehydrogenase family)